MTTQNLCMALVDVPMYDIHVGGIYPFVTNWSRAYPYCLMASTGPVWMQEGNIQILNGLDRLHLLITGEKCEALREAP